MEHLCTPRSELLLFILFCFIFCNHVTQVKLCVIWFCKITKNLSCVVTLHSQCKQNIPITFVVVLTETADKNNTPFFHQSLTCASHWQAHRSESSFGTITLYNQKRQTRAKKSCQESSLKFKCNFQNNYLNLNWYSFQVFFFFFYSLSHNGVIFLSFEFKSTFVLETTQYYKLVIINVTKCPGLT